ncbi:2OG-Fe(II) oxygenase [Leptolyngbya ohadii]|uniref:2OG-Fe(II) oxygenase n=1 Tax=Leptolyngbya ohadii TaxID=1962290 RepID=UPI000B59E843|nr:2OG-Fe(II) oxygenase [Leptolyngbya ohadii]
MSTLTAGDHAPWFVLPSHADILMGGYRSVLFFFGGATQNPQIQQVLTGLATAKEQLAAAGFSFFGVSIDPRDKDLEKQISTDARFRLLWDFQGDLSIRYGILGNDASGITYDPTSFILDENLRVMQVIPLVTNQNHVTQILQAVQSLPPIVPPQSAPRHAPVLQVPQVFSPSFCRHLIQLYEADGGTESGFMQQDGEKTAIVLNSEVKRRRDLLLTDPALQGHINSLIWRRVAPEIEKAFQFKITHYERYTVACYEEGNQGFFSAHRDNTTMGSAHRRFAMTLNLNTGEYEGGSLHFPEYSTDRYSPGIGDALIFSCSLLHEATPVTKGRRFVLLSFFFNEEDAKLREQTQKQIVR